MPARLGRLDGRLGRGRDRHAVADRLRLRGAVGGLAAERGVRGVDAVGAVDFGDSDLRRADGAGHLHGNGSPTWSTWRLSAVVLVVIWLLADERLFSIRRTADSGWSTDRLLVYFANASARVQPTSGGSRPRFQENLPASNRS